MKEPIRIKSISVILLCLLIILLGCNSENDKSKWVNENHEVIYKSLRNNFPDSYNKQAAAFYDYLEIVDNPEFDDPQILEDCKKYYIIYRKETSIDFNDPFQLKQVRNVNGGTIGWVALIRDKEFLLQYKK